MKVSEGSSKDRVRNSSESKKKMQVSNVGGISFLEEVHRVEESQQLDRINLLLKQVDDQAERLRKNQTVRELQRYKQSVRDFLKETTGSSYQRKQERHLDRRGNFRVLTLVSEVDKKIGELTTLVLDEQRDPLLILQKLGEIRGILVDLYS